MLKAQNTLADFQYQFDPANNLTQMIDGAGAHNYTYDALNRLTAVGHPAGQSNESYGYDDVGNRTISHQGSSYSYQAFNHLVSANGTSFGYDTNGNVISKTEVNGSWTYSWDYENRLQQAVSAGGVTVNYSYDALGHRVQRSSTASATTKFVYDGLDVVRDLDTNGSIVADYLNERGIDQRLRQTHSGNVTYFLADHLGTTRALADIDGTITSSIAYDSFGTPSSGSVSTRYTYTGREADSDTGLMYYRARLYMPEQGRFSSNDPIELRGGINPYVYVQNSPLTFRDPLGLEPCCKKTWTDCYAQCIENNRFDNLLPVAFSALPKRFLPPFRVVTPEQPLTTLPSVIAHYLPRGTVATGLRTAGRFASRIATPVLVFEGFYDLGLLGSCAELCYRNPCN